MAEFKPTLGNKPKSDLGKKFVSNFDKTMKQANIKLDEVDNLLTEKEQSLKKKIFSLAKMEALVFSDPKLSMVYDDMAEDGEEKYGYHYNETIMNMIFNDYILNSPKYLQKYKMAIPKKKKRRDISGINQLKKAGKETMKKSEIKSEPVATDETGTAGGVGGAFGNGSGQYTQALDYDDSVNETTGSASSGAYVGPAMWGSGDLMKAKGKAKVKTTPMIKGGTIIQENNKRNYLINPTDFEKYIDKLNEQIDIESPTKSQISNSKSFTNNKINDKIIDNTSAFTSDTVKKWNKPDTELQNNTINTGKMDEPNLKNMEENIKLDEKSKSIKQQQAAGIAHAAQKGEIPVSKLKGAAKEMYKMKPDDLEDFAKTKHKNLPEKVNEMDTPVPMKGLTPQEQNPIKEDMQSMIGDSPDTMALKPTPAGSQGSGVPMGMSDSGGMSESYVNLLEELNDELKAFSIHHNNLKKIAEDRRPSALVLKDRLGSENVSNFKKDLKDSSVSKIVDIENALEYSDQQTEIKNPYELGEKIEKGEIKSGDMKSGEALKNVGNSANDKGDEIPKRNLTQEEQDEVNKYRLGLGDVVFDNEPGKRFEDRMKSDMGDKLYKQRQEKLEFRSKAPMYNKDSQPVDDGIEKVQFNKEKSTWNEREGLKESVVTGMYFNAIGKKKFIDFNLSEVKELKTTNNKTNQLNLFEVNFAGLGNSYTSKVDINESAIKAISKYQFFTDGMKVFAIKNHVQNLTESGHISKNRPINEQFEKMKHLLGYKPNDFVNTKNIKEKRGF